MIFLQVALNGDRQHRAVPRSPDAIGKDAEASIAAGARSVHVHAYDDARGETLDAAACGAVMRAIRARCPGVPVSLTTSATIMPDLVTANQGEEGITELSAWLMSRGVGIEAGLLPAADARAFVASPIRDRCRRAMIEPLDPDPAIALRDAAEMEAILTAASVMLPQVHHGYDGSCWAVNQRALARGHGIRTGMEDVAILPDGRAAKGNAQLVEVARRLIEGMAVRT